MILSGKRALTVLGLTALLLPARAAAEEPPAEQQLIEAKKALDVQIERLRQTGNFLETDQARSDVQKLEADLQKKMAEMRELESRLRLAQEKAKNAAAPRTGMAPADAVRFWQVAPGGEGKILIWQDKQVDLKAAAPGKGTLYELVPGEKGTLILRPVAQPQPPPTPVRFRVEAVPGTPVPPQPAIVIPPARRTETDVRTRDLEKRLDAILHELEQLRKEIRGPRAGMPADPARPVLRWEVKPEPKPNPTPKPEEQGEEVRKLRELRQQQLELEKILQELQKAIERKPLIEAPKP